LDFFVDRIAEWRGSRDASSIHILDIGCGKGNITLPLASLGYAVTGVDFDADSLTVARQTAKELSVSAEFLDGSLERVSGKTFDVIIASEVLEHQKKPREFLDGLSSLLAKDGLLLLSVPNGTSLEERIRRFTTRTRVGSSIKTAIKRRVGHESVQSAAAHPHEQFFSWKALQDELYGAGWKVQTVTGASAAFKEFFYLFGRFFMRRGSPLFHRCDRVDAWLAARVPLSVADGWLIESRPFDASRPLVLHIVTQLMSGGAERLVHDLVFRLPKLGFRAEAIALFGGGPLESLFKTSGAPLTVFPHEWGWWMTFWSLRTRMARERPAIVHTHLFGADVIGRLAAFTLRRSITISTEHNMNLNHGPVKRLVKRLMARGTTAFIAISNAVKTYMESVEGIPASKIRIIPNGIDMARVEPRPPGPFHDIPRFITVGRLTLQKDHATLLKALALIKRPWRLELVGEGELETPLHELAERLGIAARVHWMGFRDDVPRLLSQSDVFCFPSRWEGLGLAFLEAASAGVPVVASDLPVFRDILSADQAVYVPPGDVPAWAHAIEGVLADPLPVVRTAYEAALDLQDRFSIERMVDAYAGEYRELLAQSKTA
jgi:glycosyltransferase involved in cell wall biosynthesis/2-polyprenyl-3-methyl-5-hydroxy-6-metoxy-1,4-benzoquinol methylase